MLTLNMTALATRAYNYKYGNKEAKEASLLPRECIVVFPNGKTYYTTDRNPVIALNEAHYWIVERA